ncbi:MAG: hypothetical protein JO323_03900 [Acidobacteriia bacterium]|nr:hypothetical protein [Terriglobia bacterium]
MKNIVVQVEALDQKKTLSIDSVSTSRRRVRPGEKLQIHLTLNGENRVEMDRTVEYQVPAGAPEGLLYFTASDANVANINDFRQLLTTSPHNETQLIGLVNGLHPNNKVYVRVWRTDPAYQLEGADLPDPPASVSLILSNSQANVAGITQVKNSKIDEIEIDAGDMVVSGNKTVLVEVKE